MPKLDLGQVKGDKGDKGDQGVGVKGIELTRTEASGNKVYSHILTNNNKLEFEVPRGPVGATGAKGDKGDQGVQGVGIDTFRYKELAQDGSFIYTITLTNGETYDLTSPIGPKGDKGDKGEPGKTTALSLNSQDIIDNWKIFSKDINDGDDLNLFMTEGIYVKPFSSYKVKNCPSGVDAFALINTKIQRNANTYVTQILQNYWNGAIHVRAKHENTWESWKELANLNHISTLRNEINDKFTKYCPYKIGDIYITTNSSNPSSVYLGTTWQKIEGRFLLGTSGSYAVNSTGGKTNVSLEYNNMPSHRHKVNSSSASIAEHTHQYYIGGGHHGGSGNTEGYVGGHAYEGTTLSSGAGTTGTFAPYTDYQGSGSAFSIMPPYIAVNIWKRLS